jgi:hypothetical protein
MILSFALPFIFNLPLIIISFIFNLPSKTLPLALAFYLAKARVKEY